MKIIITSPFQNITDRVGSHRSAQAYIYASMIKEARPEAEVTINVGGKITDLSPYDEVWVYHGNDFQGGLNLYGGVKGFDPSAMVALSRVDPSKIRSLGIPFPDYATLIRDRLAKHEARPEWYQINLDNLDKMANIDEITSPNRDADIVGVVLGDSHATSLYRPGFLLESIPYKTLFGILKGERIASLVDAVRCGKSLQYAELYFGNIDIRHHLCRQEDPIKATENLAKEYVKQAETVNAKYVNIYEPLPIENESRKLPKTGYYKGTPFYGAWHQRDLIRDVFIRTVRDNQTNKVNLVSWTDYLKNDKGELRFECMEKPQSVHLSRAFYPFWQGTETAETGSIEEFME